MASPAGFLIRFLAFLIDALVLFLAVAVLRFAGLPLPQDINNDLLVLTAYHFLLPQFWNGFTVGKRVVGIRIATMNGEKPRVISLLARSFILNGLYPITYGILFLASVFMVIFRKDKRSIHDLLVGTQVIRTDGGYRVFGNL